MFAAIGDIQEFKQQQLSKVERRKKEEEKIKKGIYQMHVMVEGQCMDTLTEECEKGGKGTAGTKVKENQDTASQKEGAKTDPHTEMERMFAAGRNAEQQNTDLNAERGRRRPSFLSLEKAY